MHVLPPKIPTETTGRALWAWPPLHGRRVRWMTSRRSFPHGGLYMGYSYGKSYTFLHGSILGMGYANMQHIAAFKVLQVGERLWMTDPLGSPILIIDLNRKATIGRGICYHHFFE